MFIYFLHLKVVAVDQPAEFSCNITGSLLTTPVINWAHNGVTVTPNSKYYFPQPNILRINQVTKDDTGMYQCFVRVQSVYELQAAAELIVQG